MGHNIATFLWRTLYLQTVRRHPFWTVFELLYVALFFYFSLIDMRPPSPLNEESKQQDADSMLLPKMPSKVLFGPGGSGNEKLMRAAMAYIEKHQNNTGSSGSPPPKSAHVKYLYVDQSDKVANVCLMLIKRLDVSLVAHPAVSDDLAAEENDTKVSSYTSFANEPLCVALAGQADGDANLTYTVYAPVRGLPTQTPVMQEKPGKEGSFTRAVKYQYVIEQAHKKLRREAANFAGNRTQIKVENLPGWVFEGHTEKYMNVLFLTLYAAFFVPLLIRISSMGYEFTSGLADQQGVMGLSGGQFIAGHFLTAMAYGVIEGASVIVAMYIRKMEDNVTPFAHDIDPSLLAFSFVMFHIGHTLLAVMIAWVFPEGWTGLVLGVLVMMVGPGFLEWGQDGFSVPEYILMPRRTKLLAGMLPQMGTAYVLRILFLARDYEGKAGWSLVFRRVLERDNIAIFELWAVMLASDVAMIFLTWYLSKVLPWSTNNPQGPCFCLRANYWNVSVVDNTANVDAVERDPRRFEQLPPSRRPVIVTQNLVKVFGTKTALNSVDLRVYEPNVTVLLGHNGAGKTTLMSILTGMQAPTSGMAHVCGLDVATQADEVRKKVSFCQQQDIFFPDLTCIENMLYFGSLKGVPPKQLAESIKSTLSVVKLEDKAYSMPGQLSGGMKRRLSIAITIVSKPDILILDEPTTGLDPETRRTIWDVMQNVAKERTVLLSSHDMDEADAIGDHIIIMSSGTVVCSGSAAFLKKACGVGYKLTMVKVPNVFNLNGVHALVKQTAPMAEVDEDKQEEAVISLHTLDHKQFPPMFQALESSAGSLGIAKMGVTVASMKDVYLKINLDWAPGGKQREQAVNESDIANVCQPFVKTPSSWRCFYALWVKRLLYLARSWGFLLSVFVLPLLLLLLVIAIAPIPSTKDKDNVPVGTTLPIELSLATHYPDSTVFVEQGPGQDSVSAALRVLVESQGCSARFAANVTTELRQEYILDFGHYMSTYPMAVAFESNVVRVISNPTLPLTLPLAINLVDSAELRSSTAQPLARIDATIAYIILPRWKSMFEGILLHMVVMVYWPALPALSYTLAFAGFAAFPVAERLDGARDVQLMTGISGAFFIASHALFDLVHYVIVMGLWCLLHFYFSDYGLGTAGYIFMSFACHAPSTIGMAYLLAEWAVSTGKAIGRMMIMVYAGGLMAITVSGALNSILDSENHRLVLYLFPPYALTQALFKITDADMAAESCKQAMAKLGKTTDGARMIEEDRFFFCRTVELLSFDLTRGIALELMYMVGVGLAMLVAMSFLTSGYLVQERNFTPTESKLDDDVEEHRRWVDALKEKGDFTEQALVAWRLHKRFGTLHAVKGLYLALRPSECFGLLGVNGAGKTTMFQMLAKLISASYGDAYTAKARLSGNTRQWQSQISYCFQLGGLLDRLNSYEYLYLIGRLRGISDADLRAMVDSLLSVVDLKEHASKPCGVYSGGNRRKLSIGAALLGLPPLVYLDEPYAGVDVVSRNKIFRAIATLRKKSSTAFVLTSHNMEKCEFSCDRVTIMAAGEMMCLGTLQHLREKFGQGYRLEVTLTQDKVAAAQVTQAVQRQFPGATVTEKHENMQGYHLTERMPWSELFRRLCRLEEECALQHAMVGENTLEQIFLQFAKPQGTPGDTPGNADPKQLVPAVASRPEAPAAPRPAAPVVAS